MPSSCILLLLDGLGDRSHACLGHRTPLDAAHTPHLDALANQGANGLFHARRPGIALPSEEAHFSLFGYQQMEFPGRGPLEALGADIPLQPGQVAILAHGTSIRDNAGTAILKRGVPKATEEEAETLLGLVSTYETDGIQFQFHRTKGLFGVLVLTGAVDHHITDSDPIREDMPLQQVEPWRTWQDNPVTQRTATALNTYLRWCWHTLKDHPLNRERIDRGASPINGMVTQRSGQLSVVESMEERFGLRGLSISSGQVYWGLGNYLGMSVRKVMDSFDPGNDIAERLMMAQEAAGSHDFIHVHTKAPDEAAHRRSPQDKVSVIESLDRGIGQVMHRLLDDQRLLLAVTADHSTPSSGSLIHSGEPVALMFIGDGVRRDRVTRFSEIDAPGGALGYVQGQDFIPLVLNYLDRAKLAGLMDTPVDQPFWPGRTNPFRL